MATRAESTWAGKYSKSFFKVCEHCSKLSIIEGKSTTNPWLYKQWVFGSYSLHFEKSLALDVVPVWVDSVFLVTFCFASFVNGFNPLEWVVVWTHWVLFQFALIQEWWGEKIKTCSYHLIVFICFFIDSFWSTDDFSDDLIFAKKCKLSMILNEMMGT